MPIALSNTKHLTHSNWLFSDTSGATWQVMQPRKLGVVMAGSRSYEREEVGAGNVVAGGIDGYTYNYYHRTSGWTNNDPYQISLGVRHSNDGLTWYRPAYTTIAYHGRTGSDSPTNLLMPMVNYPIGYTVMKDAYPSVPGGEVYKMLYELNTSKPAVMKLSSDGKTWSDNGSTYPFTGAICDGLGPLVYEPNLGKYVFYGRGWTPSGADNRTVIRIEIPVANIKQNWETAGIITAGMKSTKSGGTNNGQVVFNDSIAVLNQTASNYDLYNSAYTRYASTAHFMFPSVYDHTADLANIHVATSSDGITWTWPDGDGLTYGYIERGAAGEEDCGMCYLSSGGALSSDGSKVYQYYYGSTSKHSGTLVKAGMKYRRAVFATEQRLDGFVAMRARSYVQTWTTQQITFSGSALKLNANAQGGRIRVALANSGGTPITGYTLNDCYPITTDDLAHQVHWTGNPSLSGYAGTTVRLLIEADKADLFALQFS